MIRNSTLALLATTVFTTTGVATVGHAAGIEGQEHPKAMIATSATVPAGSTLIWLSGVVASPIDPKDVESPGAFGNTEVQTVSILTKIKAQLAEMGLGMGNIVKLTVFLVGTPDNGGKMDRDGMMRSYLKFFGTKEQPNLPTRSTVQVAALGRPSWLVEIEAVVAKAP